MNTTKMPGEHAPISKEERQARKVFREVEAQTAMADHETAKQAFSTNHQRLRAERMTREAEAVPVPTKKAEKVAKKK